MTFNRKTTVLDADGVATLARLMSDPESPMVNSGDLGVMLPFEIDILWLRHKRELPPGGHTGAAGDRVLSGSAR